MGIIDQKVIGIKVNVDTGSFTDLVGNQLSMQTVLADDVIVAAKFEGRDSVTGVLGPIDFTQSGTPQYFRIQVRSEKRSDAAAILYAWQFNFNQGLWPDFEDASIGQITWGLNFYSTELQTKFAGNPNAIDPIFSITYKSAAGPVSTLLQTGINIGNLSDDGTTGLTPPSLPAYLTADEIRSQYLRRENNGFWANVLDKDLTAPPVSPNNFDRYIVAGVATGAWVGQEGNLAVYNSTSASWEFFVPKEGWQAYVVDETAMYSYLSATWGLSPVPAHASQHQNGGSDEINVDGLSGELADAQPSQYQKDGSPVGGPQPNFNIISGNNTTVTLLEDAGDNAVDLRIDVLDNNLNQDFDTSIVDADPGSGNVRFDNASPASVTQIFASDTDKDGLGIESQWDNLDIDDEIIYRQASDTSKNVKFKVDGATVSATGYSKLQVVHVSSNGTFDNGAELSIELYQVSGGGDVNGTTTGSNNRMLVYSDGTGKNIKEPNAKITANSQIVGDALDPVGAQDLVTLNHFDNNSISALVEDLTPQLGGPFDTNSQQVRESKGADIASAGTLPIGTDGNYFNVTGTTTITTFNDLAVGTEVTLEFDGILTLTHNANIILPNNGSNIATTAGDKGIFRQTGTGPIIWECVSYSRADGTALQAAAGSGEIETNSVFEYDSAVTASDPGAGKVKFDSVTMGSITAMYISGTDRSVKDISSALNAIKSGMTISFGDVGDATGGAIFSLDGDPVDNTGWFTVAVSFEDESTTGLTNTEKYGLQVVGGVAGAAGTGVVTNINYEYDSTVAKADPGAGKFRLNNATPLSATEMYIDYVDKSGIDLSTGVGPWLEGLAVDNIFRLGQTDSATAGILFEVDGAVVDETGYYTIPINPLDQGTAGLTNAKDYGFQFQGGGSGGGAFTTSTQTAGTDTEITFTDLASGSYELKAYDLTVSVDNAVIHMEVSTDNGSTWKTTSYIGYMRIIDSGGFVGLDTAGTTKIFLCQQIGNAAGESGEFNLVFDGLDGTALHKHFKATYSSINGANQREQGGYTRGRWDGGNDAIDAIRIFPSSGTFSGTLKLRAYGAN